MTENRPPQKRCLFQLPWWTSVLLAIASYYCLKYLVPQLQFDNNAMQDLASAAPQLAPIAAMLFLLHAATQLYKNDKKPDTDDKEEQL